MLSLYIHIPFCIHKCTYCSFFVLPENDETLKEGSVEALKKQYFETLLQENKQRKKQMGDEQVKTIYIGGGTPLQLGKERLFTLIDTLLAERDTDFLEELSIELNPDPFDEVLEFVQETGERYAHVFKLRFSFGIQSFDDDILKLSKRNYIFNNLMPFFRELQPLRKMHMSYNFDFIAFGGAEWDQARMEFFMKLVNSHLADGYSIYTLEITPGSDLYNETTRSGSTTKKIHPLQKSDEEVYAEFERLSSIVQQAGYKRYELSNFALQGKRSLHNMVYRTMEPYLGLGINASSMLPAKYLHKMLGTTNHEVQTIKGSNEETTANLSASSLYRFNNVIHRKQYLAGEYINPETIHPLTEDEYNIEKLFLGLRTDRGIADISTYADLFENNREELLHDRAEHDLVIYDTETDHLKLTNRGLDLYNTLITDLLKEI